MRTPRRGTSSIEGPVAGRTLYNSCDECGARGVPSRRSCHVKLLRTRKYSPLQGLGSAQLTAALAPVRPKQTDSGARRPNLAALQRFCQGAFEEVTTAR